jgi:hypothetical protein
MYIVSRDGHITTKCSEWLSSQELLRGQQFFRWHSTSSPSVSQRCPVSWVCRALGPSCGGRSRPLHWEVGIQPHAEAVPGSWLAANLEHRRPAGGRLACTPSRDDVTVGPAAAAAAAAASAWRRRRRRLRACVGRACLSAAACWHVGGMREVPLLQCTALLLLRRRRRRGLLIVGRER